MHHFYLKHHQPHSKTWKKNQMDPEILRSASEHLLHLDHKAFASRRQTEPTFRISKAFQ